MPTQPVKTWDALKALYRPDDNIGVIFFSAKEQPHKPSPEAFQRVVKASEAWSPDFQKFMRQQNGKGYNVSVGANPLQPEAKTRNKETVKEIRFLYLDLDTKGGRTGADRLQSMLADKDCPRPRLTQETSPGNFQVLWEVKDFTKPQAEETLRRLAAHYGGDLAIGGDIARALRIPEMRNKKYAQHDPKQAAPATPTDADRDKAYGPRIIGNLHERKVHSPAEFAYLPPVPDRAVPVPQQVGLGLAADQPRAASGSLPGGFDAPSKASGARSIASGVGAAPTPGGADQTGSGQDWGHANRLYATGLRAGKPLAEITPDVRTYLERSASDRGRTDGPRYANVTINKLLKEWETKQHDYAPRAVHSPAPAGASRPAPAPVGPAPVQPVQAQPQVPAPGVATLPPGFERTPEQRGQDAKYVLQSLLDGQSPDQIRTNMLQWHLNGVPGASEYIHEQIRFAQSVMSSDRLITVAIDHSRLTGAGPDHDFSLFRSLLQCQADGAGVLANAVRATQQAEALSTVHISRLSPGEDAAAFRTAFQIASLALAHGDRPSHIEAALSQLYHPTRSGPPASDITQVVQQAMVHQHPGTAAQLQELVK